MRVSGLSGAPPEQVGPLLTQTLGVVVFVKPNRDADFAAVAPLKWSELFAAAEERTVGLPNGRALLISSERPAGGPWTLRSGDNLNVPAASQPPEARPAAERQTFDGGRPRKRAKLQRDTQVPAAASASTRPKKGPKKR